MRIPFHQIAVFEGSRFRLVSVADDVLRLRRVFRDERPFHAGRESRAAATAKSAFLYFLDDVRRRHLERFFKAFVTARLAIHLERVPILDVHPLQLQWLAADRAYFHKSLRGNFLDNSSESTLRNPKSRPLFPSSDPRSTRIRSASSARCRSFPGIRPSKR